MLTNFLLLVLIVVSILFATYMLDNTLFMSEFGVCLLIAVVIAVIVLSIFNLTDGPPRIIKI